MAENVKVNVDVTDNGSTAKVNNEALKLKKTLEGAQAAARIPLPTQAAQQGVAASSATKTTKASSSDYRSSAAADSNLARGTIGDTGAGAKDFAAQAAGLGGLVHVYATFAANLYAISTAFTALSNAVNTAHLVQGLDQIGAASGQALGTLSKQLNAATDGALSMKDAITATARASASGIAASDILRIGAAAKNASQAMGFDMPNAIERLTLGIAKQQPRLLDELGIIVKVGEAHSEYARKIGKTVASLTDFEKQQAFTNATLDQAEKKFGSIHIDTNPYAKLLASIENLAQTGLTLINTVLGPIVNILSSNPIALTVAIGGVASMLLKQALPALGQWRQGLIDSAAAANKTAIAANELRKAQVIRADAGLYAKEEQAINRISSAREVLDGIKGKSRLTNKLLKEDMSDITIEQINALDKQAAARESFSLAQAKGSQDTLDRVHLEGLAIKNLAKEYRDFYENRQKIEKLERESPSNIFTRTAKYLGQDASRNRIADNAQAKAQQSTILGSIAETLPVAGIRDSFIKLLDTVGKAREGINLVNGAFEAGGPRMTAFAAASTVVRGSLAIVTTAVSTLAVSLGNLFGIIGLITIAFQVVDYLASTATKEAEAFKGAFDTVQEAAKGAVNTLEAISKKDLLGQLSVESVNAKAVAMYELTSAFGTLLTKFDKLKAAQSGWESFWDKWLFDFVGKSDADKLSASLSSTIVESLNLMSEGPAKEEAKRTLQGILGQKVDLGNFKEVNASIKDLDESVIKSKAKDVTPILDKISSSGKATGAALVSAAAAVAEINKQFDNLTISNKLTDPFSKLGTSLIEGSTKIDTALKDPINGLTELISLAGNLKTLSFLPEDTALKLAKSKDALAALGQELAAVRAAASKNNATAATAASVLASNFTGKKGIDDIVVQSTKFKQDKEVADRTASAANQTNEELSKLESKQRSIIKEFASVGTQIFAKGIDYAEKGLTKALGEASILAAKGYVDILRSIGGNTAEADAVLANKAIDLQIQDIKAKYSNTQALTGLSLKVEADILSREKIALEAKRADIPRFDKLSESEQAAIIDKLATLSISIKANAEASLTLAKGPGAVLAQQRGFATTYNNKIGPRTQAQENSNAIQGGAALILRGAAEDARGMEGGLAAAAAQKLNVLLKLQADKIREATKESSEKLELDNRSIKVQQNELSNLQSIVGTYDSTLERSKELLDTQLLNNEYAKKSAALEQDKLIAQGALDTLNKKGILDAADKVNKEELTAKIIKLNKEEVLLATEKLSATEQAASIARQRSASGEAAKSALAVTNALKLQDALDSAATSQASEAQAELANRKALGTISETELSRKSTEIELAALARKFTRESISLEAERLAAITLTNAALAETIRLQNEAKAKLAAAAPQDQPAAAAGLANADTAVAAVKDKATTEQGIFAARASALAAENSASTNRLIQLDAQNQKLAEQADLIKNINDLTNSLGASFGKIGTSLGTLVSVFAKMAERDEGYSANKIQLIKDEGKARADLANPDNDNKDKRLFNTELSKTTKEQGKLESKNTQAQLSDMAAIAGATKGLFKEKTFAYKAAAAVEKAIHIAKIAAMIKEAAVAVFTTAPVVESNITKAGSSALAAITAAFAAPFPLDFITGAAMIGIMASLLGKSFGGGTKGAPSAGFSAADQQKVQGTGQQYNAKGEIVDRAGGVMGDSTAIAKSIDDSIKLIEDHSFKNLEFSNKMLDSLRSIKENTNNLAQLLISAGIGNVNSISNKEIKTGVTGVTGGQYGVLGAIFGKDSGIGKLGSKIFTGIFGGKTTTELKDQGIVINDTIAAISTGASKLAQVYTNVQTKVSGGLFKSDKISNDTKFTKLDKPIAEAIGVMFGNIKDTLIEASTSLGKDKELTTKIVESFVPDFKVSSLGLKPEELAAAISGEISIAFNAAAKEAFPELEGFRKLGEEFGTTIVRLARDIQLTDLAFTSIGMSINTLTGVAKVDSVEHLLKLTGGIDSFLTKTDNFKTNFLTAAEQLAPVTKAVNDEMTRLKLVNVKTGEQLITTREQFAKVVKSLDLTNPAAQQLYADLLNVSDAFAEVHAETRKTLTAEELAKAQLSQQIDTLKLLDKVSDALALSRADELSQLDPLLRAGKQYIWQLEDRLVAIKSESALLSAIGATYEALQVDRQLELRTLTDSEKITKLATYAAQDKAKTDDLLIQLMEATGDATGALNAKRKLEIRGLSAADAALKSRIYRLQDETALKAKLKTAYDKESSAIKTTITGLKDSVKALAAYKTALKEGDKSTLDPQAKYETTKAEALRVADLANSIATTEAEKSDKQAAINQLPAATDAFLAASQIIYASSEKYTQDFNTVLDLISSTGTVLDAQQSDAEKQLEALDASVSSLGFIESATQTTAELLQQLVILQGTMYAADIAASSANATNTDYVLPDAIFKQLTEGMTAIFTDLMSMVTVANLGIAAPLTATSTTDVKITDPNAPNMTTQDITLATSNALLVNQVKLLNDQMEALRAEQTLQTAHMLQITQDTTNQLIAAQKALADATAVSAEWASRNTFYDYTS
jgi:hypothetical protein